MADLSKLSDEQLGVYRDLLAQKQGVPGMEGLGGGQPPAVPKPINFIDPNKETATLSAQQPSRIAQDHPILSEIWKGTAIPNPEAMSAGPLGEGLGMAATKALGGNVMKSLEDFNILHPFSPKPLITLAKGTATDFAARAKDIAGKEALQAARPTTQRVPQWTGPEAKTAGPVPFQPTPWPLPSGRTVGPAPLRPPLAAPTRTPLWSGIDTPQAQPLPDASPIPGKLPSGRTVGPAPAQPAPKPFSAPVESGEPMSRPGIVSVLQRRINESGSEPEAIAARREMSDFERASPAPLGSVPTHLARKPKALAAAQALSEALSK